MSLILTYWSVLLLQIRMYNWKVTWTPFTALSLQATAQRTPYWFPLTVPYLFKGESAFEVLSEHQNLSDGKKLEKIAKSINEIHIYHLSY